MKAKLIKEAKCKINN